jgi:hypothetical protein
LCFYAGIKHNYLKGESQSFHDGFHDSRRAMMLAEEEPYHRTVSLKEAIANWSFKYYIHGWLILYI